MESKISAQVVLAPASGARIGPDTVITSQNIEQYRPSPDAASTIRAGFTRAGFEVSPLAANSFSITAAVKTFEDFFKTKLGEQEIPLSAVPTAWKKHLIAITFTPPPDFGPTGY